MTFSCLQLALMLLATPLSASAGITWHVDDDAPGDPAPGNALVSDPLEDGSARHPFDRVQEAVAAALNGDTVLVEPGLYRDNIAILGKAITLRSLAGAKRTIINGGNAGTVVLCSGGGSAERSSRASLSSMATRFPWLEGCSAATARR